MHEAVKERPKGCEMALTKVDVKAQLANLLDRGLGVKIPQKFLTGVLVAPDRIWYGGGKRSGT